VAAFEDLYARHFDSVYGYLRVMLGDSTAAEAAVQDVFAHAFHAERGTLEGAVRPWLFWIARQAVSARGHSRGGALDDGVSDPWLMRLVMDLPELERETIVLRHLVGLSARETAQALGRSRLAAGRARRRGLRALQNRARRAPDPGTSRGPVLASASPG
jgi:DNA-directed RNA polymerase specialized sigma24 family protein